MSKKANSDWKSRAEGAQKQYERSMGSGETDWQVDKKELNSEELQDRELGDQEGGDEGDWERLERETLGGDRRISQRSVFCSRKY